MILFLVFLMLSVPLFVGADPNSQLRLSKEVMLDLHSVLYPVVNTLRDLSGKDYAPAQRLLGFLIYNPTGIKEFLEEYDERKLKPYLPSSGHSRNFWQRIGDVWRGDLSPAIKEADTFIYGSFFLPAMGQLRLFFSRLETIDSKYDWSEFVKNSVSEMLGQHSYKRYYKYYRSKRIVGACEKTFKTYFR